jgi:signal transduction histidine kinase
MFSLRTLAGGLAHDFNNILTSVIGNIDLIDLVNNPIDENQGYLGEIRMASNSAKVLVNQLLTFSKPAELVKEVFSIADLLEDSIQFFYMGNGC